jgi:hypothetical protein
MILFKKLGQLEKFDIMSVMIRYKRVLLDVGVFGIDKDMKEIGQRRGLNVINKASRGSGIVTPRTDHFLQRALEWVHKDHEHGLQSLTDSRMIQLHGLAAALVPSLV